MGTLKVWLLRWLFLRKCYLQEDVCYTAFSHMLSRPTEGLSDPCHDAEILLVPIVFVRMFLRWGVFDQDGDGHITLEVGTFFSPQWARLVVGLRLDVAQMTRHPRPRLPLGVKQGPSLFTLFGTLTKWSTPVNVAFKKIHDRTNWMQTKPDYPTYLPGQQPIPSTNLPISLEGRGLKSTHQRSQHG